MKIKVIRCSYCKKETGRLHTYSLITTDLDNPYMHVKCARAVQKKRDVMFEATCIIIDTKAMKAETVVVDRNKVEARLNRKYVTLEPETRRWSSNSPNLDVKAKS